MSGEICVSSIREILHKSYPPSMSGLLHHAETEYELICVDYGRLTLELDQTSLWLKQGSVIIIAPDVSHRLRNTEKGPMHFLNVMFSGSLPESLCGQVFELDKDGYRLMMEMHGEFRQKEYGFDQICCHDLIHILIRLKRQSLPRREDLREKTRIPQNIRSGLYQTARSRAILEKVYNQYRTIRFPELAASSGVSLSELYLIFRNEIGRSFRQVVSECKLEQAQYLLQRGDLSLAEIASDIGCELPSLFRMFKQLTGMTPGEYSRSLGLPTVAGPDPFPGKREKSSGNRKNVSKI